MIYYDVEQNSDEWFALRVGRATSSNYACFMANYGKEFGEPAKRYALQIALELINGKRAEVGFSNDHTERGKKQEPIAIMMYEDKNFIDVGNGGFFDHITHGDSPDGLVGNDGVLEIKSVIAPVHYATLRRGSYDPVYKWQHIGHLDGTGRDWVDSVSFCSEFPARLQLITHRIYRHQVKEELAMLQARRGEFLKLVSETIAVISA